MEDIQRYAMSSIHKTAKQLIRDLDNGTAKFDNAVQRSLVWTHPQKSLFIQSLILGAPVPPMYAAKNGNELDFMDGKQRTHCIRDFINNQFELVDLTEMYDRKGNKVDYDGCKFEDLPEEIQDYITGYSIVITTLEDISDEGFADIFYRLNSGSALKNIEKDIAKTKSLAELTEIVQHPIFEKALSNRAREQRADYDIAIKSLIMLKQDKPNLDRRNVSTFTRTVVLTKEDVERLLKIYTRILELSTQIHDENVQSKKVKNSMIARRILGRSHIISLVPFVERHIDEPFLMSFLWHFYSGQPKASISTKYNVANTQGSGHTENVKTRQTALEEEYKKHIKKK